ncbi:MAG: PD40 domain-containing protein [Chloroflexi bacterium]|nr:PD40 domain-containing protein [Chloroflexota bacterium]
MSDDYERLQVSRNADARALKAARLRLARAAGLLAAIAFMVALIVRGPQPPSAPPPVADPTRVQAIGSPSPPTASPTPTPAASATPTASNTATDVATLLPPTITLTPPQNSPTPIPPMATATTSPTPAASLPANRFVAVVPPNDNAITISSADGTSRYSLSLGSGERAAGPGWSPDGLRIVYGELTSGNLFTITVDGKQTVRLTSDPLWYDSNPVWSPAGTQIAFVSTPRAGNTATSGVYLWDIAQQSRRRLADGPARYLTFSPDGKWLAYRSPAANGDTLHVAGLDGRKVDFAPSPIVLRHLAWTPDSRDLLYEVFARDTNGDGKIDEQDKPDILVGNVQSLTVKRLTTSVVVISPRGRFPGPPQDGEFFPRVVSTVQP